MKTIRITGIAFVGALATTMHAQTYKVLAYLSGTPSTPVEPGLIAQSPGGNLMTTASDQDTDLRGVAFRVTTEGVVTVLHEFSKPEGVLPASGLTLARDGRSYGTTVFGGASNTGTVFQMTPDGIAKTLHQFSGAARWQSICSARAEPLW